MAFIYYGGTTDDVPLFCVDVGWLKNLVLGETSPQAHFPLWKSAVMTDEIELLYSLVRF